MTTGRFASFLWTLRSKHYFKIRPGRPVDLPHDWMIYDTENLYEQAISCYRRIINKKQLLDKADPDTQKMELIFEGVYMDTTIYLNQKEIFTWKHGYSGICR